MREPNWLPDLVGTIQQMAAELKGHGVDESPALKRAEALLKAMGPWPLIVPEDDEDDADL